MCSYFLSAAGGAPGGLAGAEESAFAAGELVALGAAAPGAGELDGVAAGAPALPASPAGGTSRPDPDSVEVDEPGVAGVFLSVSVPPVENADELPPVPKTLSWL